jgi:hypothetical protein
MWVDLFLHNFVQLRKNVFTFDLFQTVMIVGIAGACTTDEFCKMNLADISDHGQYVCHNKDSTNKK